MDYKNKLLSAQFRPADYEEGLSQTALFASLLGRGGLIDERHSPKKRGDQEQIKEGKR
jgi:hypothetical protein